ncbi:hypothetical protein [Streptomyces sp. NPDC058657]|uniref:hypothetical protein n=1 Tax=unclassified Streptomyces TaxID=2593676 RepID=UPI003658BDAD
MPRRAERVPVAVLGARGQAGRLALQMCDDGAAYGAVRPWESITRPSGSRTAGAHPVRAGAGVTHHHGIHGVRVPDLQP